MGTAARHSVHPAGRRPSPAAAREAVSPHGSEADMREGRSRISRENGERGARRMRVENGRMAATLKPDSDMRFRGEKCTGDIARRRRELRGPELHQRLR
jgi:hypothetical protein